MKFHAALETVCHEYDRLFAIAKQDADAAAKQIAELRREIARLKSEKGRS